jgi:hypothetical protein
MNLPAAEQRGIKPSFRKTQRAYAWFDMLTTLSNLEGESRFPLSRLCHNSPRRSFQTDGAKRSEIRNPGKGNHLKEFWIPALCFAAAGMTYLIAGLMIDIPINI